MEQGIRYVALWVPNWPLSSLVVDTPPGAPAAVIHRSTVEIVTPAAFGAGVRRGMSQTAAQYNCPNLLIFPRDEQRENAAFETVLSVFDEVAAGVIAIRPGLAFAPARGAARWAGGEQKLFEELIDRVVNETGAECQVGIASGLPAALLAARMGVVVAPGETEHFLDGQALSEIVADLPWAQKKTLLQDLEVLRSLGILTGGQLRRLGADAIVTRFGATGDFLWRVLAGPDPLVDLGARTVGTIQVDTELDPPALNVEHAVTGARRAAMGLSDRLTQGGLYSSTLRVSLERVNGTVHERVWTFLDVGSVQQVAKRILWQMRGWADRSQMQQQGQQQEQEQGQGQLEDAEEYALKWVRLSAMHPQQNPEGDALWGGTHTLQRAGKAVEEVQSLLGEEAVLLPTVHGGFDPRTRVSFRFWGSPKVEVPPSEGAWEGGVSRPPVVVFSKPPPSLLVGNRESQAGGPIWVNSRGTLSGKPHHLIVQEDRPELPAGSYPIVAVRGLWMVRGRWWQNQDPAHHARCYLQVSRQEGPDLLLVQQKKTWWVEGVYASDTSNV